MHPAGSLPLLPHASAPAMVALHSQSPEQAVNSAAHALATHGQHGLEAAPGGEVRRSAEQPPSASPSGLPDDEPMSVPPGSPDDPAGPPDDSPEDAPPGPGCAAPEDPPAVFGPPPSPRSVVIEPPHAAARPIAASPSSRLPTSPALISPNGRCARDPSARPDDDPCGEIRPRRRRASSLHGAGSACSRREVIWSAHHRPILRRKALASSPWRAGWSGRIALQPECVTVTSVPDALSSKSTSTNVFSPAA